MVFPPSPEHTKHTLHSRQQSNSKILPLAEGVPGACDGMERGKVVTTSLEEILQQEIYTQSVALNVEMFNLLEALQAWQLQVTYTS